MMVGNERELKGSPEDLGPALDILARRGFKVVERQRDGGWRLEGPAKYLEAMVYRGSFSVHMAPHYVGPQYVGGATYERRRLSFGLHLTPEQFDFFHYDEQWDPDEYLNVDHGVDTTHRTLGQLEDLYDFHFDSESRELVIEGRAKVRDNMRVEIQQTGLSVTGGLSAALTGIGRLPRPDPQIQRVFVPRLECGEFAIRFQISEESPESQLRPIFVKPQA